MLVTELLSIAIATTIVLLALVILYLLWMVYNA